MARKDFQKGMIAGAEPFEAKFQQQAEAVDRIGKRVEEGLTNISAVQNVILGDLSAREKKELYDLNTYVDISELEDTEKELLMAILYTLSDMTEEVTAEQQVYIRSVKAYLNVVEVQVLPDLECIENIDSKNVEKAILQCVMEFLFLENCNHGYRDEYADVLEYFSIREKEIEKIITNINTIYKATGTIGLAEKYGYVPVEEEFGADAFYDEDIDISTMEDYEISEILHIAQDEVKKIRNKQVHLKAYVDCSGTLEFEQCVIYYNENAADEITLHAGAFLKIRNSVVVCKGADNTSFITGEENNCVVIEKTIFENCSKFIRLSSCQELSVTKCELKNCGDEFLYVSGMKDTGVFNVSENTIYENDITEFNQEGMQYSAKLMHVYSRGEACLFENNTVVEAKEFSRIGRNEGDRGNSICYFSGNIRVQNCSFEGVSTGIKAKEVVGCKFLYCQNVIETEKGAKVDKCLFENCTRVILAEQDTVISNCKFIACYNELISGKWFGGVVIEFCQFVDTKYLELPDGMKKSWLSEWRGLACITLKRSKESYSRYNTIKKCIFDGAEIGKEYFLIAASGYEKPSGTVSYIEECTFENCGTKRSTGKIIKEYISYDTIFKKDQSFHANEIRNCKGLDHIIKISEETKKVQDNASTAILQGNIGLNVKDVQDENNSLDVKNSNEIFNREPDIVFSMDIEYCFGITTGVVDVRGKIQKGVLHIGDKVKVGTKGGGQVPIANVLEIFVEGKKVNTAKEGDKVKIFLSDVNLCHVKTGYKLLMFCETNIEVPKREDTVSVPVEKKITEISDIDEKVVFKLVVEDVFTITGRGTVATGTIEKGTVKECDKVELRKNDGTKKVAEIRGIDKNKKIVSSAGVGDTVGLLLKGITRSDVERGDIVVIVQN